MKEYFDQCCLLIFLPETEEKNILRISMPLSDHFQMIVDFPVKKYLFYNEKLIEENENTFSNFKNCFKSGITENEQFVNAFRSAFNDGFRKVVLLKTSYKNISVKYLKEAFLSLKFIEFSIGPDANGGFYLIGMNSFQPSIFKDAKPGDNILKSTIKNIGHLKLALYKLPVIGEN